MFLAALVEVVAREEGPAALAEGVDLPGGILALVARAFEMRDRHARLYGAAPSHRGRSGQTAMMSASFFFSSSLICSME